MPAAGRRARELCVPPQTAKNGERHASPVACITRQSRLSPISFLSPLRVFFSPVRVVSRLRRSPESLPTLRLLLRLEDLFSRPALRR